jgi:signal transduction histidine kinase
LNSKKADLLLGNILIIFTIAIMVLLLHHAFQGMLHDMVLDVILVCLAVLLYLFLGTPMIDNFLKSDTNLKTMVDETLHELNTPIATIEANLSMLKKSITDEKSLKRLNRIGEASKNLTKLYESIEYNIKENIQQIEKSSFDLQEIIEISISKFDEIKEEVKITNFVSPLFITTDKNGFSKMVDNLISNAIKYNKKDGFVKIYMNGNTLYIQDSGIGIDTKNLFIVFDKSYQENPSTEGYGIGLSIVKSFCDTHKIKIKIDTQKDMGTTIGLDLGAVINPTPSYP